MKTPDAQGFDALVESIAEATAKRVVAHLVENGPAPKLVLTPEEAAAALGFTFSAFNQSDWKRELPVVKVGKQNRYRLEDLQVFVTNHREA
jgi:hypothetical protein